VLWHPEAGEDQKLFEALVAEARSYREAGGRRLDGARKGAEAAALPTPERE
jgi:hypothetical protein